MNRAEMERIAAMDVETYSRWAIGSQLEMFRAASARLSAGRPDVPHVVSHAHAQQRVPDWSRPWTTNLRNAGLLRAATQSTGGSEPPRPWTLAAERRRAEEGL